MQDFIAERPRQTHPRQTLPYSPAPLRFLQESMLAFSTIRDSHELDELLDQFFCADTTGFVSEHSSTLHVLSMAWSATIRRVVFQGKSVVFPNKLLLLPPLYQALGWTDRQNREWDNVHAEIRQLFDTAPALNYAILLLFIDGMMLSLEEAVFLFLSRLDLLGQKSDEIQAGRSLIHELHAYGWPKFEQPTVLS